MAGRSAGGGSRGGGSRGGMGGSRGGGSRGGMGGSRGSFGGSRAGMGGSRGSFGGNRSSSGSRSSSGHSVGSRSSSGRSFSSSGPNRNTSSRGSLGSGPSRNYGSGYGGGMGHIPPRPPRPPRPFIGYGPIFTPRPPRHGYNTYGSNVPRPRRQSGCLSIFLVLIVFFFIMGLATSFNREEAYDVTSSTVKRVALEKGAVIETEYFEDNLDWIHNKTKLETGLKNFYNLTGLQPFILLVETVGNDPSDDEIDAYANTYYDEHFKDEAHLLFIYIQDIDYMWAITGSRGNAIMDSEAWDILFDYVEKYWHSDLEDEEMFSKAFTEAGERIMADPNEAAKSRNNVIIVIVVVLAVIIIVSILRKWWKDKKEQKNREDENLKEILNTPLDTFGSEEVKDLMDKYDNKE